MIKFITAITIISFLLGCTPKTKNIESNYDIPEELSDCVFLNMRDTKASEIKVVRCPNSTTSVNYASGKTTQSVIVVDGVEYVAKDLNK